MKKLAAAALAALLAACGGGGSDSPAPGAAAVAAAAASPTFNLDAAITNVLTKGLTLGGLQGQLGGASYGFTSSVIPADDSSIFANGTRFHRAVEIGTVTQGATTVSVTSQMLYFSSAPLQLQYATAGGSSSAFTQYTPVSLLPTAASVGQSGTWNKAAVFPDQFTSTQVGSQTAVWSLEADSQATAWACLTFTITGAVSGTEKDCYRIDAAGSILAGRFTATVNGQTVTFQ